jgi:holin-like protein
MAMTAAVAGLFFCQLVGEILAHVLHLPLPGPVAGMGLMFLFLVIRGRSHGADAAIPSDLASVSDGLLRNLSLLFIPAAVGIIQYFGLLWQYALAIVLSILVSTVAALVATVLVFRAAAKLQTHWRRRHANQTEGAEP